MNKYPVYEAGQAFCPECGNELTRPKNVSGYRCVKCERTYPLPPEVAMAELGTPRLIQ